MIHTLAQTPLHDWHVSSGARMVDFAGWSMPVQYSSIVAEHTATRNAVGLFDISHMGRLRFDGDGAAAFLDSLLSRRVTDLKPGRIRYALVTNQAGGILDDVLVYHLLDAAGGSYWLLVVNAGNRAKILDWIKPRLADAADVQLADLTEPWAMISLQGPRAAELVRPLVDVDLAAMKYYTGAETGIAAAGGIVTRTGYTGEDGYELIVGARAAEALWKQLVRQAEAVGGMAAGLGSRDTLRLEAGLPLYGHEIDESIDPFAAGLQRAVDLEGRVFPGSDKLAMLESQAPLRQRVGLELEGRRVARQHDNIVAEGRPVGWVTSGTFSPTFEKPLAMGYVATAWAAPGTPINVEIRGRECPARIVELPFYRRSLQGSTA